MIELQHLLIVADAYRKALKIEERTVSSRVFGDGKKLSALRSGSDITLTRFNDALRWFSANWPEKAKWPAAVARPVSEAA